MITWNDRASEETGNSHIKQEEKFDRQRAREVFDKLEKSGQLESVAKEIIKEIISETDFFDDIISLGFKLNERTGRNLLLSFFGRDNVNESAFIGHNVSYKKAGASRYHGSLKGERISIYDNPCSHSDLLRALVYSENGGYPDSLRVLIHEVVHLNHLKEIKKKAGLKKISLPNKTINEAFARRFGDIPIHEFLSKYGVAQYIERELLPQSESDYRYIIADGGSRDNKISEWRLCFLIIDLLSALGLNAAQIGEWLADYNVKFIAMKKVGEIQISEIEYYLKMIKIDYKSKYDQEGLLVDHHEKKKSDFKNAQDIARKSLRL